VAGEDKAVLQIEEGFAAPGLHDDTVPKRLIGSANVKPALEAIESGPGHIEILQLAKQ
jgi:hypothetical protein